MGQSSLPSMHRGTGMTVRPFSPHRSAARSGVAMLTSAPASTKQEIVLKVHIPSVAAKVRTDYFTAPDLTTAGDSRRRRKLAGPRFHVGQWFGPWSPYTFPAAISVEVIAHLDTMLTLGKSLPRDQRRQYGKRRRC